MSLVPNILYKIMFMLLHDAIQEITTNEDLLLFSNQEYK